MDIATPAYADFSYLVQELRQMDFGETQERGLQEDFSELYPQWSTVRDCISHDESCAYRGLLQSATKSPG